MTDHDNLRDRIAELIWQNTMVTTEGSRQIAQEIIDEFGLTVEGRHIFGQAEEQRIVGKWEQ